MFAYWGFDRVFLNKLRQWQQKTEDTEQSSDKHLFIALYSRTALLVTSGRIMSGYERDMLKKAKGKDGGARFVCFNQNID